MDHFNERKSMHGELIERDVTSGVSVRAPEFIAFLELSVYTYRGAAHNFYGMLYL